MELKHSLPKPKILTMQEIKEFLIYCRRGGDFFKFENHPYNRFLKNNNNKERHNLKVASLHIKRFLLSEKTFYLFTKNYAKKNKFITKEIINKLLQLINIDSALPTQFKTLAALRKYFIMQQGTIFWIHIIRITLFKLIKLYLI